jgi:transcriptional regulator with XRE-family HTH domain
MKNKNVLPEFGNRVREIRTKLGLSQAQLSERTGVSKTSIQNYERGLLPNGLRLLSLSRALGTSIDYLVCGADNSLISKDKLEGALDPKIVREVVEMVWESVLSQDLCGFFSPKNIANLIVMTCAGNPKDPDLLGLLRFQPDKFTDIMATLSQGIDFSQNVPLLETVVTHELKKRLPREKVAE